MSCLLLPLPIFRLVNLRMEIVVIPCVFHMQVLAPCATELCINKKQCVQISVILQKKCVSHNACAGVDPEFSEGGWGGGGGGGGGLTVMRGAWL